jgi:NADH-quinone oxidoreductase subunit C/D
MFSWKQFEESSVIFSQDRSYQGISGQHNIWIRPVDLLKWISLLKEDLGFLTLVDLAAIDHNDLPDKPYRFELIYIFFNMGNHQRLNIHLLANEDEIIPSIYFSFENADWLEREQAESFGLKFDRKMENLFYHSNQKFPLRKNSTYKYISDEISFTPPELLRNPNKSEQPYPQESWVWKRFDVLSNITRGLFEWLVCFDPNKVVDSRVRIGFHHYGFEKLLETRDWNQSLYLVDRSNLLSAPNYSLTWVRNLEEILRIRIPERAQAIRMVALELARIVDHLTVISEMTSTLNLEESKLLINCREKIFELIERFCGHRQFLGLMRLGGVHLDFPHGWIVQFEDVSEIIKKNLNLIHHSLISQKTFRNALYGPSLDSQIILNCGVTGPAMRAAGLNFDLRKSHPFYFYQDVDFDIPVGIHGTAYDRYLIRVEEIFQSFRIVTQVIDNLPLGETILPEFHRDYYSSLQEIKKIERIKSWHYNGIESPNGELGFSVFLDNEFKLNRVKIKTPSFTLVQALGHLVKGIREDQLELAIASLGIRPFELDR